MVDNKDRKQDTLLKACLKTVVILVLLSTIGFVVSYMLMFGFEKIFKVNDNYTVFELMYKEGASVKYFSSAKIKIVIQTMIYMICVFIMFLVTLNIYFKRHILTKKDSIFYSLFVFLLLYSSSFILIRIGIKTINDVIESFNNVVLTYNTNTFENYLKKLSNLRMLVTIIYSFGATLTCLFSLIIIRSGVDEVKELDKANEEKKKSEDVKKVVVKKVELPKEVKVEEKKEETKENVKEETKEEAKKEVKEVTEEVKEIPKEEDLPKKEDIPEEIKIIKKDNVSEEKEDSKANINIASELDEEEKRIVSELNGMLDKITINKEEKKAKEETKVSFVGQSKKKKK